MGGFHRPRQQVPIRAIGLRQALEHAASDNLRDRAVLVGAWLAARTGPRFDQRHADAQFSRLAAQCGSRVLLGPVLQPILSGYVKY